MKIIFRYYESFNKRLAPVCELYNHNYAIATHYILTLEGAKLIL